MFDANLPPSSESADKTGDAGHAGALGHAGHADPAAAAGPAPERGGGFDPAAGGGPRAVIELREAVALIVGVVVGAGIFKAPSMVAGLTGEAGWMFAAWALGGAISLVGALCYAT